MTLLWNEKERSYKLRVCCYFSEILRINRVRGSAQSGLLLGNRRAKVSIFSAGPCLLRVLIEKETSRSLSSKMRRRDKRDWMNNGRLCIFFTQNLNKLAALVRGELPKLTRNILCALITIDVHARDIVTGMVAHQVGSLKSGF